MTKVFVYGTLKRGYGNNQLLSTAEFIGSGQTAMPMLMLNAGFPVAMLPQTPWNNRAAPIKGEVYEVDIETLKRLDRLESEGRMYLRDPVAVRMDDGTNLYAQMYRGNFAYWQDHTEVFEPENEMHDWRRRSAGWPEQVDS